MPIVFAYYSVVFFSVPASGPRKCRGPRSRVRTLRHLSGPRLGPGPWKTKKQKYLKSVDGFMSKPYSCQFVLLFTWLFGLSTILGAGPIGPAPSRNGRSPGDAAIPCALCAWFFLLVLTAGRPHGPCCRLGSFAPPPSRAPSAHGGGVALGCCVCVVCCVCVSLRCYELER